MLITSSIEYLPERNLINYTSKSSSLTLFNYQNWVNTVNKDSYVLSLSNQFTQFNTTNITIDGILKQTQISEFRPFRDNYFGFVFDYFEGLLEINGWSVEELIHVSIYNSLHDNSSVLPFCMNKSGEDKIDWSSCKTVNQSGLLWEINTTSTYPGKYSGIYFKEYTGNSYNYGNASDKYAYWLEKLYNKTYTPKICIFGYIDSNGTPMFIGQSATDSITLKVDNSKIPSALTNVHLDMKPFNSSCNSFQIRFGDNNNGIVLI